MTSSSTPGSSPAITPSSTAATAPRPWPGQSAGIAIGMSVGGSTVPPAFHGSGSRLRCSESDAWRTAVRTSECSQTSPSATYSGYTVRRGARTNPEASVAMRRRSSSGHGRSGFTWSGVTGETPPQSSIPAASSAPRSSERLGGACRCMSAPSTRRAAATVQRNSSGVARRFAVHRGAVLRQEVLDDHLLHVTVARVAVGDRVERVEPFGAGLADADEDPGGERDLGPARGLEGREPAFGGLVGGADVRTAGLAESRCERLDHHPLRRADRPEPGELRFARARPALAWGSRPVSVSTA